MKKTLLSVAFLFATFVGVNAQQVTWTQDQIEATADGVSLTDANGYFIFPGGLLEGTLTAVEITATKVSGTTPAGELSIYVTPTAQFAPNGLLYAGGSGNAIGAGQWYTWPNNDQTTISGIITLDTPITFTETTTVILANLYQQDTQATWDNVTVTLYGVSEFSGDYCISFISGPWTDFNNPDNGGGAPASGVTHEITDFEIFASEQYTIEGFTQGNEYTFSACNGPGVGSWALDFTVRAPSGEVVAYGTDADSSCSITWTATEDGTYLIGISEAENCGVANSIGNGFPALTNNGTASIDTNLASTFSIYPNPASNIINITNSADAIENVKITDMNGRVVKNVTLGVNEGQINISDLSQGVYILNATSNGKSFTEKVIKK